MGFEGLWGIVGVVGSMKIVVGVFGGMSFVVGKMVFQSRKVFCG